MKNIRLSKRHERIIYSALSHAIIMTEEAMIEGPTEKSWEKRWNKGKLKEIEGFREIYRLIKTRARRP